MNVRLVIISVLLAGGLAYAGGEVQKRVHMTAKAEVSSAEKREQTKKTNPKQKSTQKATESSQASSKSTALTTSLARKAHNACVYVKKHPVRSTVVASGAVSLALYGIRSYYGYCSLLDRQRTS